MLEGDVMAMQNLETKKKNFVLLFRKFCVAKQHLILLKKVLQKKE